MDVLIQLIGGIGYITIAFSYFKKEKVHILFLQIIAYIIFAIHYYMLNGITGAICNVVGGTALIIIFLFQKFNIKNKNILIGCMVPIVIVISIFTYQNIYSVFPMIASVIAILSFISNSENEIRAIGFISIVCWLVYAIIYKSYVSIAFEVATLIFIIIAIIRNFKNEKNVD